MRTLNSIVVLLGIGSLVGACSAPEASEPKAVRPVRAQAVAAVAAPPGVRYSASIEAFEQVSLSFKASGYVDDVLRRSGADGRVRAVQAGDLVGKGTVLARVRESEYRERATQGRAKLAEAEASMTKARLDVDRARTLFEAESLTKPELDAARAAFDSAEARVIAARADVELAATALRDCALVTPSAGMVLERRIEVGTLAGAGTVGFVLGDLSSVKARFGIPDSMIQSVTLGDTIGVIVEAIEAGTFTGRVTALAPAADPQSRVFDVEITIPNKDGRLRPGMIGTVAIGAGASSGASGNAPLAVPLTAIVRAESDGQFALVVLERQGSHDIARRRRVELGEVIGNEIVVRSGVTAGERVVTSGATLVVDGEAVRILQ
jgi:RND family efflux transporter MFP subunit